jgi:hypothetical protein
MNRLERAISQVTKQLSKRGKRFALVGGLAVSARTEPRFTRDVDFAVAVSDDREAERLIRDLVDAGYRLKATVEQDAVNRLATVRLLIPEEDASGIVADLLFASSGIETELVGGAEPVEIVPGLIVPLPHVGHLLALKVLSRDDIKRPQDLADIRALLKVADDKEIERTRNALSLITDRGFNRNRDLHQDLDALLETYR